MGKVLTWRKNVNQSSLWMIKYIFYDLHYRRDVRITLSPSFQFRNFLFSTFPVDPFTMVLFKWDPVIQTLNSSTNVTFKSSHRKGKECQRNANLYIALNCSIWQISSKPAKCQDGGEGICREANYSLWDWCLTVYDWKWPKPLFLKLLVISELLRFLQSLTEGYFHQDRN